MAVAALLLTVVVDDEHPAVAAAAANAVVPSNVNFLMLSPFGDDLPPDCHSNHISRAFGRMNGPKGDGGGGKHPTTPRNRRELWT